MRRRPVSQLRPGDGSKHEWFKIPVGLATALREAGVSPEHAAGLAGLSPEHLQERRAYASPAQYYGLWSVIATISGDPDIGIRLARSVRPDITEPLFLAMMSAPDVAGAVDVVARFRRLLDPQDLTVSRDARGRLTMIYRWPACAVALPHALIDAELALFVELCRRGTGCPGFAPCEIQMTTAEPAQSRVRAAFFGCPVRYGARRNAMTFDEAELARPFRTHNPDMLNALVPFLRANMPSAEQRIVPRVRAVISARLGGGRPDARLVAKELAVSIRGLQRQLRDNGTSFRRLLDAVRNEHAKAYLEQTQFTDGEIAFLLGFDDPNSFYRAFRAWNGKSPGMFRARRKRQRAPT